MQLGTNIKDRIHSELRYFNFENARNSSSVSFYTILWAKLRVPVSFLHNDIVEQIRILNEFRR